MKLSIMQFPTVSSHFLPLRPKYLPQPPILKQPRPMFFPECARPSFTPTLNERQEDILYLFCIRTICLEWNLH